jgi:hypothetical protein
MKEQNQSNNTIRISKALPWVTGLLGMMCLIAACRHDPMSQMTDDPNNGNGNPVDTTDTGSGNPCDSNKVYFSAQILPFLRSNCAKSGCHDAITHEKDVILDSYQHLMQSDIIRPFDPEDSDLVEVLLDSDPDKKMPPPPNAALAPDQIQLIVRWIAQGAQDLSCDPGGVECQTDNVSYAQFVKPLVNTYCTGCHSGSAPSGGVWLNTYEGVRTVALNGRLEGAITWSPGFQRMPQGGPQLMNCQIDKIKVWIANGALQN